MIPEIILNEYINNLIKDYYDDKEIYNAIVEEFTKKGLSISRAFLLFDEDGIFAEDLSQIEKIAILSGVYKQKKLKDMKPEKYFSNMQLAEYESVINVEDNIEKLEFFGIKYSENNYHVQTTMQNLYLYATKNKLFYNFNTQRKAKYEKLKNGNVRRKASLNKKAVREIGESILKGKFHETEIILNCRMIEGKDANFKFAPLMNNYGKVEIIPEYDRYSNHTTYVDMLDGFHRINGVIYAIDKAKEKGEHIDGNISIKLVLANEQEAKSIVEETFKRTDTSLEWLETLTDDTINIFINNMIDKSKALKNTAATYEEAVTNNSVTAKSILRDTITSLNISTSSKSNQLSDSKKYATYIDYVYETIKDKKIDNLNNVYIPAIIIMYVKENFNNESQLIDNAADFVEYLSENINEFKLLNNKVGTNKLNDCFKVIQKLND